MSNILAEVMKELTINGLDSLDRMQYYLYANNAAIPNNLGMIYELKVIDQKMLNKLTPIETEKLSIWLCREYISQA